MMAGLTLGSVAAGTPMQGFAPSHQDNMNGEYPLSKTPGGKASHIKRFADYPGGVESFEVYSPPMTTLYSQVWWSPLPPVDLPADIVRRYNGTAMALVGWEVDQVRRTSEGVEKSVPMSASYNHHWDSWLIGAEARVRKVSLSGPDDPAAADLAGRRSGCGAELPWDQPQYVVEGPEWSVRGHPTHAALTSGNGGEFRKTLHGFAPGYALVVDSPAQLQITPMNIDTWNREAMDLTGPVPPPFVAGPLPRASLAPKGAQHSGLLECPMTTRLTKAVDSAT
ncbi:hypothetical protein EMIHUDRAFT_469884, partial [Emiliania huxleyi CCMP1516]|uniref:Uncharacterized protein n=2 Tax=Emiliania huxleyi TaxID=2903 RepID=A0A0D3JBI8_EMIH1